MNYLELRTSIIEQPFRIEQAFMTDITLAWEEGVAELKDSFMDDMEFDHEGLPILGPYVFGLFLPYLFPFSLYSLSIEENNKYLDPSSFSQSPLALAKQMLERNDRFQKLHYSSKPPYRKAKLVRVAMRRRSFSTKHAIWMSTKRQEQKR